MVKKCITCNKEVITDYVEFKCPNCGKSTISRCDSCKNSTKQYKCKNCNFIGP